MSGDYQNLNNVTIPDKYPIPHLQDFSHNLFGCAVFSTIDLVRADHQIPIEPGNVPKTAISTPFGLFEFKCMSFGLRNAAQSFQRHMHSVLKGFEFGYSYLDDLLVASRSYSDHLEHLKLFFTRLIQAGLVINIEKCKFAATKINFVGYTINSRGMLPAYERIETILAFSCPENVKKLKRFLGMLNFYRLFLPHAALRALLNDFTKGVKKNDKRLLVGSDETVAAFDKC